MTDLRDQYSKYYQNTLVPLAEQLEIFLKDMFSDLPRIDRISVRPKNIDSFVGKALRTEGGERKYDDPINQIQDLIGARIITFYKSDVGVVSEQVSKYFRHIELKVKEPESHFEFSYFGLHYVLIFPDDVTVQSNDRLPNFFELQVKTLFQHAWSEANHDLGYKTNSDLCGDFKRKIALTSAQAWGADEIFNQLHFQVNNEN